MFQNFLIILNCLCCLTLVVSCCPFFSDLDDMSKNPSRSGTAIGELLAESPVSARKGGPTIAAAVLEGDLGWSSGVRLPLATKIAFP